MGQPRRLLDVTCRCGKVFRPTVASSKYCSRACYYDSKRKPTDGPKCCTACGEVKSREDFYNQKKAASGKNPKCKPCVDAYNRSREDLQVEKWRDYHRNYGRRWHLRKTYGITIEQYDALYDLQGGVCAICSRPETRAFKQGTSEMPLAVDHSHGNGAVRGLLCQSCNQGLGQLGDSIERLQSAIDYLRSHSVS